MARHALVLSIVATACGGTHDTPTSPDVDGAVIPDTGHVATDDGPVHGTTASDLVIYKGIPYAKAERWMPPHRPEAWTDPFQAIDFGPACPQEGHADLPQAEDCLSLNVWAHADATTDRPVIVYIHGGGYIEGSSRDPSYDGADLARNTGAVVVTLNYRLGVFGYLAMTELAAPDGGIGNFGLRDQIAALEWVHRNIAAFGGDPAHVLVAGESAGGGSVCALVGSPLAQGLFSAASIQSGPCRGALSLTQPTGTFPATETFGKEVVAKQLGCTTDVANCLRGQTMAQILSIQYPAYYDVGIPVTSLFQVVDPVTLPERPFAALAHVSAPIIVGSNREDAGAFTYMDGNTPGSFDAYVHSIGFDAVKSQLDALYPTATMGELGAIVTFSTDLAFACNVALVAATHTAGPTYAYELDRGIPNGPLAPLASTHGYDFINLFGTFSAWSITPGPDDIAVSHQIQNLWASVASGQAPWPATPGFLQIDVTSTAGTTFRGNRCQTLLQLGLLGN